jgi:hypothetical protein
LVKLQIEQSIEVFQRGLKSDPYHCPLYQAFGMMLSELGRADAARYAHLSHNSSHKRNASFDR